MQLQEAVGAAGEYRLLAWREGALQLAFYAAPRLPTLDHAQITAAFRAPPADAAGRFALLAGSRAQGNDAGRIICSCFGVGETAIRQAMAQGCDSPAALGNALKCGTGCGSCIPELKQLLLTPATA